jgi:hypothetical protein
VVGITERNQPVTICLDHSVTPQAPYTRPEDVKGRPKLFYAAIHLEHELNLMASLCADRPETVAAVLEAWDVLSSVLVRQVCEDCNGEDCPRCMERTSYAEQLADLKASKEALLKELQGPRPSLLALLYARHETVP